MVSREDAGLSGYRHSYANKGSAKTDKDKLELHRLIVQHIKDKDCALSVENNLQLEKLILEHLNNTGELI